MATGVGSRSQPFVIDEEDEDVPQHPFPSQTRQVADIWRRGRQVSSIRSLSIDEHNTSLDEEIARQIQEAELRYDQEVIDLTQDEEVERRDTGRRSTAAQSPAFSATHKSVAKHYVGGILLQIGDCVELKEVVGEWDIQFVELKSIWVSRAGTGGVILRGIPYSRARSLAGRLPCKRNEVCQILELNADVKQASEPAAFETNPEQILRRRSLYKTNGKFPDHQYAGDRSWLERPNEEKEAYGPLICRWKMRVRYMRKKIWRYDGALIHLLEGEIEDPRFRVSDQLLRKEWLGTTHARSSSTSGRKLTFADIFSGCGGVTRGAVMAGLEPTVSVDHWDIAWKSFKRNFPRVRLYNEDVFHFINRTDAQSPRHVDILHLSPPCQFFAPCHTREGKNDDKNSAALFACYKCVEKLRPRLVLLEQTFGLVDRHEAYFNAFVESFASLGYSVQWRVVPLIEFGLPQNRKRLIIIAACPGEKLPSWPAPTHGPRGSGLKSFVTEAAAFQQLIPNVTSLHDVRTARRVAGMPRSGGMPFSWTITCAGPPPGVHHYGGTRDFTLRELACLQGFPKQHVFEGSKTQVQTQIGNAFAPCVAKVFLEHLRKCLERRDAIQSPPLTPAMPAMPATPQRQRRWRRQSLTASSPTIGSGSSSGSSLGSKRKREGVDDRPANRHAGMESLLKRIQSIEVSTEPDCLLLDKSPSIVGSKKEGPAAPRAPPASGSHRRDWTPFPALGEKAMSFPKKLWKLPMTRASSAEWRF